MRSIRWTISGMAVLFSASIGAAPSVALVAPAPEVRYVAPAAIELAADPTVDAGRSIERVEFLADGNVVGVVTQAPYTFSWTNVARGNYNLRARVYDNTGARDASPVVRVHVRNNAAPKVRLSSPEHRYVAPGSVPLSAVVTDRDDPIAKVEFFNGDTLLATSTVEPYAFDWTGVLAGNYEVQAKATDALGATGTSNVFRVRVRDNIAPHVRILTPDNKDTFPARASIAVSLKANDRDDNLTNVELFANGASLATFTTVPWEFNWTDVGPGTYALTARATDDLGLITVSRTVSITVTGTPPATEKKMYFVHVDHLNTPRLIADETQRTVWRWDQAEPFGANAPDEDPSEFGGLQMPMRLPGQYYDEETGLHQNTRRNYNRELARYVESDPIGLKSGLNTYAYVGSNPLIATDPLGLQGLPKYGISWGMESLPKPWNYVPPNGNVVPGFTEQDWVCTSPASFLNNFGCTLQCCIEHDECFDRFKCNASSWGGPRTSPCMICNSVAVMCMLTGTPQRPCQPGCATLFNGAP